MELCSGGELFDRIQSRGTYSEKDAQEVLVQMVRGVAAMHALELAHCDIKPDNFLFADKSEHSKLKMIDFGHSHKVGNREYLRMLVGTPYYVAPEVLKGKYNKACDMWSVGVVMFVMIFGFPVRFPLQKLLCIYLPSIFALHFVPNTHLYLCCEFRLS
jgi:calcium-dependent protein kinase